MGCMVAGAPTLQSDPGRAVIIIPLRLGETDFLAVVVLKADNIERIKQYDPAEIMPSKLGEPWCYLRMSEVEITFATDDEEAQVIAMCRNGDVKGAIRLLTRGFKYRQHAGDHNGPASS